MTRSRRSDVFQDRPVLCGHRGTGRGETENTLPSFRAAVAAGLGWVEVDARLTGDDTLVACHDPFTADGRRVSELGAAESGLMRVSDLLEDLAAGVAVNVEIKSSLEDALRTRGRTTAARVADLLDGCPRRTLVTSFDPAALLIVRERTPAVPLGLLTWAGFPLRKAIAAAAHLDLEIVVANVESFASDPDAGRAVRTAHAAGLDVGAWCPDAGERDELVALGVDYLVIDLAPDGEPAEPPPV